MTGPLKWMSPQQISSQSYSTKSDVWSFGIVLIEIMLRGEDPYTDLDATNVAIKVVMDKFVHPDVPETPALIQDVINRCRKYEPDERPTFTQLYEFISNSEEK